MKTFRRCRRILASLTLAAIIPALSAQAASLREGQPIRNEAGVRFGVLAHRGGALEWPENSLEAFEGSAQAGFDVIETDILFTKDGHAVLSHNDKLPSRCTLSGKRIHELSLDQVRQVRCANLDGTKDVPIPTFTELAKVLADHPDVGLSLDIKSYSGQSRAGKRSYATKAVKLLQALNLTERTTITSFRWDAALPAIRKVDRDIYVLALDFGGVNLSRARLAKKLGANAFGIPMGYTSAYLARYVKSLGMDSAPWSIQDDQQLSFTIHYGGKLQMFSSDQPTITQRQLIEGKIELNPTPDEPLTALKTAVTISNATYRRGQSRYPKVLGRSVPASHGSQLDSLTLRVTVRGASGGSLYLGANSSDFERQKMAITREATTTEIKVPVGTGGKLKIKATRKARVKVEVLGYTRIVFKSPDR